jgi:Rrf2 family protein
MKLTKRGEYALRAMMALARHGGPTMTISEIAVTQGIPKKFLEQILLSLKAAHLVRSRAGPKGGYELESAPADIPIGTILQAVEEPISQSVYDHAGNAPDNRIETVLQDLRNYVRRRLEAVSLQELSADRIPRDEVEALMWYI